MTVNQVKYPIRQSYTVPERLENVQAVNFEEYSIEETIEMLNRGR